MRTYREKRRISILPVLLITLGLQAAFAQSRLVEIKNLDREDIQYTGFRLDRSGEVSIEVVASHKRSKSNYTANAWILNAENRDIVWELTDSNSRWKSRELREYSDKVDLPAGSYEVYFSVYPGYYHKSGSWSLKNWLIGSDDNDDTSYREFSLQLSGNGVAVDRNAVRAAREKLQSEAVVAIFASRDDLYRNQGFTVKKPVELMVYALGEIRDDGAFDYGWIVNTKTRERIWVMSGSNTEEAGGSNKNRVFKGNIKLDTGSYALFYVTDDSHSPIEWNSPPPCDPEFWGVSCYAVNKQDVAAVERFEYQEVKPDNVILQFEKVGDSQYLRKGFTLKKDMDVRIYALGEGRDGEMYDYGWIIDAASNKRVWEMDYRRTDQAGGNAKNRLFDGTVSLPKGDYIATYISDDSHSYRDWNVSPPFDQEKWGMMILGTSSDFRSNDVQEFKQSEAKNVMASIVRVGDDEKIRKPFTVKKDGAVRVYAQGEGRNGEMYDFAWIEDADNQKVVWEMTYRMTEHAGGSKKNRLFNDTVFLKAGNYVLVYESDDSHSFLDWNASAPHDPENWGVTIYNPEQ